MSLTKDERFRQLLAREGLAVEERGIPRRDGPRDGEASFGQRRIWVHQTLDPASTVYNVVLPLQIDGPLPRAVVAQTLQALVDRHESLRTTFRTVKGKPHQIVQSELAVDVRHVDLSGVDDRDAVLERILTSIRERPFALDRAPLFDFSLLRLAADVHVLVIAIHHIVFDFVSSHVLFDELGTILASYRRGLPDRLPPQRIQYLDYADWERAEVETYGRARVEAWKTAFGPRGVSRLELPDDRTSAGEAIFEPAVERFALPPNLSRQVRQLAVERGVSTFAIWLAAFQVLLHQYTDRADVSLCVSHSEREDPELERTVGFFINPVVVQSHVTRSQRAGALVRAVHDDYIDAVGRRRYPFDKLVEALSTGPCQELAKATDIWFDYQRVTRSTLELDGLRVSFLDAAVSIAKSELALTIYDDPDGCRARLDYNGARFSSALVRGMAAHYSRLMTAVADDLESTIGSLVDVQDPAAIAEPRLDVESARLDAGFDRHASSTPDRIALGVHGVHVSYRALDRRAERVARALVANGVPPGAAVGVLVPRGIESYVSLLAILKSGAVYVPMDRAFPTPHLQQMIETAAIGHLLVSGRVDDEVRSMATALRVRVLDVTQLAIEPAAQARRPLAPRASAQTAYVCFTSGSTGQSKGTFVAHGPAAVHVRSFLQSIDITGTDRVLQFAALTFDVSIEQIFSAWSVGATLVLRDETLWGIRELVDVLDREQVSVANLPTAYWNQLVRVCAASGLSLPRGTLRLMIGGGEAMLAGTAQQWRRISDPQTRLVNAYGPTEAVITATVHHVGDEEAAAESGTSIAIGRPLAGRRALVVDRDGVPVPAGAAGELCLAGPALANGYLKNARLTAAHFWPATTTGNGALGARMYRTGDWVRVSPSGSLHFLRRTDDEIKIRGVRVIPGQIESILAGHDAIVEAAVVVQEQTATTADAREWTPPTDAGALRAMVARLPPAVLERALDEAERASDVDESHAVDSTSDREARRAVVVVTRHASAFDLTLSLQSPDFIAPPREAQRNWLVNRALDECADDLLALHGLAARFVAGTARPEIAGDLSAAEPRTSGGGLVIDGQQVMQDWQHPLMSALADAVTERGGDVLEIGFGMGISAGYIQARRPRSHVIIEANDQVAADARSWKAHQDRDARITIVAAKWQDVIGELGLFDGILFDTYPLTEGEFRRHVLGDITFAEHCFPAAARHLKPGGVFTYYSNEIDSLSRRHQRALLDAFASFRVHVVRHLQPPADSQNWWADSMAVVRAYV